MQPVLSGLSDVLPMSYAADAMTQIVHHTGITGDFVRDLAIVAGCALLALSLGAATLRRRTT
jgi:ABC-2 type transport system permease protein